MEEQEEKKGTYNFLIGLAAGIILYKIIVDIIMPMFY